jgi:hypothetical protein
MDSPFYFMMHSYQIHEIWETPFSRKNKTLDINVYVIVYTGAMFTVKQLSRWRASRGRYLLR